MGRMWGMWTRNKLQILQRYLDAFTTASRRATEIVYLDLFAGQPENYDRNTREPIPGSARIALDVSSPPFTRLRFFELGPRARRLEEALAAEYRGRDAHVYAGDCNTTIATALQDLHSVRWAPTFAFIDPNGPHFHWQTLAHLAAHKQARTKVELWMLLPVALFIRTLRTDDGDVTPNSAGQISSMYGTDDWRQIHQARLAGDISPGGAREEYVNLMRWRLENDLGYRYTHPLEIFNESGRSIYHMVFATDHDAGTRIMNSVYRKSAAESPRMRAAARQRRKDERQGAQGLQSLFGPDVLADLVRAPVADRYEHEPPWRPWWLAQ